MDPAGPRGPFRGRATTYTPGVVPPVHRPRASLRTALLVGVAFAVSLSLSGGPPPAAAHVVTTKDGKSYEGRVLVDDAGKVVIETTFNGTKELPKAEVAKVDTTVPPLREQLAFRLGQAKDVPGLSDLATWAKAKGFKPEVELVWSKVLELDPQNVKAHKALGHVRVGAGWLTPEEKAAADKAAADAAQRAKGLVEHEGRWVTPQEKDALGKGLMKDGDAWVSEDEWHRRRGERKVGDAWVRVGEAEGKVRSAAIAKAVEAPLSYLWGPHVDLSHELDPVQAEAVLAAAERTATAFERLLAPGAEDGLTGIRVEVVACHKAPAYARYADSVATTEGIAKMAGFETWSKTVARQRAFWWPHPRALQGHYLFPNTMEVLTSGVCHVLVQNLLNRYKFNWRFSSAWLQQGLAYHLEMEAVGRSDTYAVGASGVAGGGDPAAWQDSKQWKAQLKALVLGNQDTPFPRIAASKQDGLTLPDLVKAWSVVDLLVKLDRAKFKAFLDGTKVRDKVEEDALKDAYGFDYRALETRWRAYVQGGFTAP